MIELPSPVPVDTPAVAFPETEFEGAMRRVRKASPFGRGLLLIVSLAAFVLARQGASSSAQGLAVLVGVLLFHELGHYAGMRLFGYRDVRMFFIPFFGAAVSGKRAGVAPWKEGVVLLLGPVPGIAAAFVLALRGAELSVTAREVAISLVSINAFNLLPLAGLDGARLLEHVLFSRRRWLAIAFQLCAALATVVVAVKTGSWALGFFAYLMLIVLPHRAKVLGAARRLRDDGVALPFEAKELEGEAARIVFTRAREIPKDRSTRNVAATMEQLVDAANVRPPSIAASFALGIAWGLALLFAVITLVLVFAPLRPKENDSLPRSTTMPGQFQLQLHKPKLLESE